TLTGPGGVGKTRLAVAVGERLRDRFGAGTAFVPLAAVTDPGLVLAGVGRAVGADLAGTGSPVETLAEQIGDGAGGGAGRLTGGGAVCRPGPRGAPRLRPHPGQRRGGGRDLPTAGGPAV